MESGNTAPSKPPEDEKPVCNVIPFPKDRIVRDNTVQGFQAKLADNKAEFISFVANKHVDSLMNRLRLEGVEVDSTHSVADVVLIYEAVKSALARIYGLKHPLHGFVDENFVVDIEEIINEIHNPDIEDVIEIEDEEDAPD